MLPSAHGHVKYIKYPVRVNMFCFLKQTTKIGSRNHLSYSCSQQGYLNVNINHQQDLTHRSSFIDHPDHF